MKAEFVELDNMKNKPKFETDNKNKLGEVMKVEYTGPELDMEVIEKLVEFLAWFDRRE